MLRIRNMIFYFLFSFWLSGTFTKFYASSISHDTVSGSFYKCQKGAMSYVVEKPINQIITYSYDTMIVYYPKRKKAFKIKSQEDVLQKNNSFTDLKSYINNLRNAGYIFLKKQKKGDTITSYWSHEKQKIILKLAYDQKGRIYEVNVKTEGGKYLYTMKAEDYITLQDSVFFPKKLITTTQNDTEIFVFDSISIVPFDSLPSFIKNPVIPDNASVQLKGFSEQ